MMENDYCCIFGNRTINETEELKERVTESVERLIVEEGVDVFLFGSKSRFCVVYFDESTVPTIRKSGTKIALDYAKRRKKEIILFP